MSIPLPLLQKSSKKSKFIKSAKITNKLRFFSFFSYGGIVIDSKEVKVAIKIEEEQPPTTVVSNLTIVTQTNKKAKKTTTNKCQHLNPFL